MKLVERTNKKKKSTHRFNVMASHRSAIVKSISSASLSLPLRVDGAQKRADVGGGEYNQTHVARSSFDVGGHRGGTRGKCWWS